MATYVNVGNNKKKKKNALDSLIEIEPGLTFKLVALYGSIEFEQPIYVMEVHLKNKEIFQGIGDSKRKAKIMASEFALIKLNHLQNLSEFPIGQESEPYCWEDYTADLIDTNSSIYFDFSSSEYRNVENGQNDLDDWLERFCKEYNDENSHFIGKNTISILSDLHPDAIYEMLPYKKKNGIYVFVYAVYIRNSHFIGAGNNKSLAKARAARNALQEFYQMVFTISEDGMPMYEGDERVWKMFKKKLEEEAIYGNLEEGSSVKSILQQLYDLYPGAKVTFPYQKLNEKEKDSIFVAQIKIEGEIFEGTGLNKKNAKANAALTVIESLKDTEEFKQKEIEFQKRQIDKKRKVELEKDKFENLNKDLTKQTAVKKLASYWPNVEFKDLLQKYLKNTCLLAFVVSLEIGSKIYIGVGKKKALAKLDAAEKALRDNNYWTKEDDLIKSNLLYDESEINYSQIFAYLQNINFNFRKRYSNYNYSSPKLSSFYNSSHYIPRNNKNKNVNNLISMNTPHINHNKSHKELVEVETMLENLNLFVDTVLEQRNQQLEIINNRANSSYSNYQYNDLNNSKKRGIYKKNSYNECYNYPYNYYGYPEYKHYYTPNYYKY